jgi:hypothetical protein
LTFKLCIGTFAGVPRETGLATPCFFDFPAMLTSSIEGEWQRTIQRYTRAADALP